MQMQAEAAGQRERKRRVGQRRQGKVGRLGGKEYTEEDWKLRR